MVELAASEAVDAVERLARVSDSVVHQLRRLAAGDHRRDRGPRAHGGASSGTGNRAAADGRRAILPVRTGKTAWSPQRGGGRMNGVLSGGWDFVWAAYLVTG